MIHAVGAKGQPRCGAKDVVLAPNILDVDCVRCLRHAVKEAQTKAEHLEDMIEGNAMEQEHSRLIRAATRLVKASSKAVGTAPGLLLPELLFALEDVRKITGEWDDA